MARILVVDDEPLARALLVDAVRGLGHEGVPAPSARAALTLLAAGDIDAAVVDADMPEVDGYDLARQIASSSRAVPVILVGTPDARAAGVPLRGHVTRPLDPGQIARLLSDAPTKAPERAVDGWSGSEFLARVNGPASRFPPLKVLFLAHRLGAGGLMELRPEGARVGLARGRVVAVEGVSGLFTKVDAALSAHDELAAGARAAVAMGLPVDRIFTGAAAGLGVWLMGRGVRGAVRFDTNWVSPPGSFPLPTSIPRIVADAVRERPAVDWFARGSATARPRLPDDAPESRWGLDPASLRVLRQVGAGRQIEALLRENASDPSRLAEAGRSLSLLTELGLVVVDGGPVEAPNAGPQTRAENNPAVARLREALTGMQGKHPVDVLELGSRLVLQESDVALGYREVSRRFHPDLFYNEGPVARTLAESCFGQVNAAYESIRVPAGLSEANRLLDARKQGVPYVTEKDHQSARVAFRKGEMLYRSRDWKGAAPLFEEAWRLDPGTWPHALYRAQCNYLARIAPLDETIELIRPLGGARPSRQAEVLVVIASVLKAGGQDEAALAACRSALEKDPENRDALRELRLNERRVAKQADSSSSFWDGFFKKKE